MILNRRRRNWRKIAQFFKVFDEFGRGHVAPHANTKRAGFVGTINLYKRRPTRAFLNLQSLRAVRFIVRLLVKGDRLTDRIEIPGGHRMRAPDLILRREKFSKHHPTKTTQRVERSRHSRVFAERSID